MASFTELEQKILKLIWKHKRPKQLKQYWERKMKLKESASLISDYTTSLHSPKQNGLGTKPEIYINRVRIESPEINPHTYGQLSYDIKGKHVHWRKNSLFNKWCWENWTGTHKRMILEHSITPTKNKLEMDQRCKCKARHYKTPRGKYKQNPLQYKSQNDLL